MKPNKITALQYSTITFFLLNSFLMNVGYHKITTSSYNDSILDILLGGITILVFSFFIFHFQKKQKQNILDIIQKHFPKIIKVFFFIILFFLIGFTSIYALSILTSFVHYYILKEVDSIIILMTLVATTIYIVSKGIPAIGKISEIFFYIYLLIFIISFIGLIQYIDLSNLKPLFITDFKSHLTSSEIYFFSSITPLLLLSIIPMHQVEFKEKNKKLPYLLILLSIILVFIQLILIISVLGIHLTNVYQTPDMIIYKKISFLNVLERIEVVLAFNNILNSLFFIIMGVYFIKTIISYFLPKKKEHILYTLIAILFIILGNLIPIDTSFYLRINIILFIVFFFFILLHYLSKYIRSLLNTPRS